MLQGKCDDKSISCNTDELKLVLNTVSGGLHLGSEVAPADRQHAPELWIAASLQMVRLQMISDEASRDAALKYVVYN
jgi:hypothetical protein